MKTIRDEDGGKGAHNYDDYIIAKKSCQNKTKDF